MCRWNNVSSSHVIVCVVSMAQGTDLQRGVTQASDYTVTVGDGECSPTGVLHSTMFQCDPPRFAPNTSDDSARCNGSFAIMVRVLSL